MISLAQAGKQRTNGLDKVSCSALEHHCKCWCINMESSQPLCDFCLKQKHRIFLLQTGGPSKDQGPSKRVRQFFWMQQNSLDDCKGSTMIGLCWSKASQWSDHWVLMQLLSWSFALGLPGLGVFASQVFPPGERNCGSILQALVIAVLV